MQLWRLAEDCSTGGTLVTTRLKPFLDAAATEPLAARLAFARFYDNTGAAYADELFVYLLLAVDGNEITHLDLDYTLLVDKIHHILS